MPQFETLSSKRVQKHYNLSETTVSYIEAYAQQNGLNYSQAVEGLVLMSLRDTRMLGVTKILQTVIQEEIRRQYNRIAKLSAYTAIQAGTAKETAQALYWWVILQELELYTEGLKPHDQPTVKGLASQFGLSPDAMGSEAAMGLFKSRMSNFRYRAVKGLRQPANELTTLLQELQEQIQQEEERSIQVTVETL